MGSRIGTSATVRVRRYQGLDINRAMSLAMITTAIAMAFLGIRHRGCDAGGNLAILTAVGSIAAAIGNVSATFRDVGTTVRNIGSAFGDVRVASRVSVAFTSGVTHVVRLTFALSGRRKDLAFNARRNMGSRIGTSAAVRVLRNQGLDI
ncbi:MAG: hypothetical protein OER86_06055, partial [Phycisphaerae bacterium]|nr:hypothetical protein [Phycisphaerae bacterium]